MANIKSALKRVRITQIRTIRNTIDKSKMKTAVRHFKMALANKDFALAKEKLQNVVKITDKLASKGVIHKNTAARKKSRLTHQLNKAIS